MKFANASGMLTLAALAVIASPLALADEAGWYGGLSVGQTRARIDDPRIISGLLGAGFTTTSINDDNRDTGYKAFAGYQLNKNFALEGGYFDLGKFGFTAVTANSSGPGTLNGDIKLSGVNLDAVGTAPINDRFSVFGRLGINYADAKDSFSGSGVTNPSPSKHDTNYKFGLGAQYAFSPLWALRAEAERYRVNDALGNKGDIDLWSLGLTYRFAKNGSR